MMEGDINMLAMSDINIEIFLPVFANTGVPVALLVPTPTGYEKSIMDATAPVRELLLNYGVHNYDTQLQGPENKRIITTYFVEENFLTETSASLYRPITKKGDPRIWFSNLKKYCQPRNLLAIIAIEKKLYVFNLSNPLIAQSLLNKGFAYSLLEEVVRKDKNVSEELLQKLRVIHNRGFLKSITPGDPGVGDTLEDALNIRRNNSKAPDYCGIELKTTRLTRNGAIRNVTRSTLFTKVPDEGLTYREIVENYGKWQIPRGQTEARLQLYETFRCSRVNAYDLTLNVDVNADKLCILYEVDNRRKFVSAWKMKELRATLLTKHPETFWIKAVSENRNGIEYFRYDKVLHTKNPNVSLLAPLLEADKITIDLAAHFKSDGQWRDHGILFKMLPKDLPLLLGDPMEYIL